MKELPFVVVLVPCTDTADPSLEYYNDYSQSEHEFARAFAELQVDWRWQPVTSRDCRAVIEGFADEVRSRGGVVFNLCDGDESNDVAGVEVIECLEELGVAYTGADADFYTATTSKIDMKTAFDRAGVSTSPWEVVTVRLSIERRSVRLVGRRTQRLGATVRLQLRWGGLPRHRLGTAANSVTTREQVRLA